METSKARIPYLDFLKFFALAVSCWGILWNNSRGMTIGITLFGVLFITYHMPLFMLLCGYFFGSSLKLTFGDC